MKDSFEIMVEKAIKKLPENIKEKIKNVAICIEKNPSKNQLQKLKARHGDNLLGLYEGVPKNVWGRGFGGNLPDKITIFKNPIEKTTPDFEKQEELIKDVVWHEVAHHFGFDEKDAKRLEKRK